MSFVGSAGWLAVVLIGGQQVIQTTLTKEEFVAFTLYLEALSWPTMAFGWAITMVQQGSASMNRVSELFDAKPRPDALDPVNHSFNPLAKESQKVEISIQHLSFQHIARYQTLSENPSPTINEKSDRTILSDVSLTIQPGSLVALVGPIGSGKSTLLKLLAKSYEVPKNSIFFNGQDIAHIPTSKLRHLIAFMSQESFLFSDTLKENLLFGAPEASDSHMVDYSTLAQFHADVQSFPDQYDTLVGERGMSLSGGQRQRASLTRTLLVDPPLLILDDPFSHVDADTERKILAAIEQRQLFKEKTTVFASHRFSLVQKADWILLMDQGKIVDAGTHQDLLNRSPLYQQLNQEKKPQTNTQQPFMESQGVLQSHDER
jgi:ATP-binding cassette subfamily B protein